MFLPNVELFPVNILQIVFACQMSFAALLMWHLKRYRNLAIFFIFQAVLSTMNVLEAINISNQYYLITPIFTLLIGPILYFFIRSLVNVTIQQHNKHWWHFIVAVLALPFTEYTQFIIALGTLSQVIYLYLAFRLITRYHNATKAVSSDADRYELTWLVKALLVFTVVTVTDLIRMNLQTITPDFIKELWYLLNEGIFLGVSCYLAFKVIRQPVLFNDMTSYENIEQHREEQSDEHQNTKDKKAELALATQIFSSIEADILQKEMFKQPRLSVTDLSQSIGINIKDISWAINMGSNRNFCDYINSLRLSDVKKKLMAGNAQHRSVLDIALASGFNSKSTFNAVFKKEENKTPSQFIREHLKSAVNG